MRVLICDQESEMLERIAREFEVDVATSKATCIDLMRANPFDVVVASERLVDGSGLELLSSIATRWPDTLRVLAIEPERKRMLGGKLAPFRLHATIRYPIDEDELEKRLLELDRLMGDSEEDYADEHEAAPASRERAPSPPQRPASPATAQPSAASGQARYGASSPQARSPNTAAAPARPSNAWADGGRSPNSLPGSDRSPGGSASGSRPTNNAAAGRSNPATPPRSSGAGAPVSRQATAIVPPKGVKAPPRQQVTGKSYYSSASRAAAERAPPLVRRKPGSYTPLGAPEDADLRIVAREFDESSAPLAERAMRAREEANREHSPTDKARSVADHVSRTLKRLLKR